MTPLLEIKPQFVPKKILIESVLVALLAFGFIGIYPFILLILQIVEPDKEILIPNSLLACLTIILTIIPVPIYYYWVKFTYKNTKYQFFEEKIIYQESFLNIEEKEFSYKRIAETALKKNIIQRIFNLGSVVLLTYASGMTTTTTGSGLKLKDLDFPEKTYTDIKNILGQHESRNK